MGVNRCWQGTPRNGGLVFLSALASLSIWAVLPSVGATLTFQRSSDALGFASAFEEGAGLPSRNFTFSATVRSSSGREWFCPLTALGDPDVLYFCQYGPHVEFVFDGDVSFRIDLPTDQSNPQSAVDELILPMRTWTVTYDDATLEASLYVDAVYIGASTLSRRPFPGQSIFGANTVISLLFGQFPYPIYDSEGALVSIVQPDEVTGIYGQLDGIQLWDRALNSSEIAQTAAFPDSLTGDEEGLCIFWRIDQGYGMRIQNRGSAGAQYDGVLGQYAVGRFQTSSQRGSDCWDGNITTNPAWVNKTAGKNALPIADNTTKYVRPACHRVWPQRPRVL